MEERGRVWDERELGKNRSAMLTDIEHLCMGEILNRIDVRHRLISMAKPVLYIPP